MTNQTLRSDVVSEIAVNSFAAQMERDAENLKANLLDSGLSSNLPPALVLGEQAAGILKSFLRSHGLDGWHCFFVKDFDSDAVGYLEQLNDLPARWHSFGGFSPGGFQPWQWKRANETIAAHFQPPGCCWLRSCEVAICRYFRCDASKGTWIAEFLFAAPSVAVVVRLREQLRKLEKLADESWWYIVSGPGTDHGGMPRATSLGWDALTMPVALRQRIESEVMDFFGESVVALYKELKIPHRRGVLLHGPPGNGKTSIIRAIADRLHGVTAMLLRPGSNFDDGDFVSTIHSWLKRAPAFLVIEDLDWLLSRINLSVFLNEIDGLDRKGGGLLLIATTNYPDQLDPAVNNRPGRFDVVVEVPSPDINLRRDFLNRTVLSHFGEEFLEELATQTDGLSFAHLMEIVSLSGLSAARHGKTTRSEEGVRQALRLVCESHTQAQRGFPGRKKRVGFEGEQSHQ